MKNLLKSALLAVSLLVSLAPMVSWGDGGYTKGTVRVYTNFIGETVLLGAYNVRFNPDVNTGFISMDISESGTSIGISGIDSSSGQAFTCYVPSSNTVLFTRAYNMLIAAGDGTSISATRSNPTTANCSRVSISKTSASLQ